MINPIRNFGSGFPVGRRKKKAPKEIDQRVKKAVKKVKGPSYSGKGGSSIKASQKLAAKQAYTTAEKAAYAARQKAFAAQRAAVEAQKKAFLAQRASMAQQAAAIKRVRAAEKAKKDAKKAAKKASKFRRVIKV
jgi:hypothetical protein